MILRRSLFRDDGSFMNKSQLKFVAEWKRAILENSFCILNELFVQWTREFAERKNKTGLLIQDEMVVLTVCRNLLPGFWALKLWRLAERIWLLMTYGTDFMTSFLRSPKHFLVLTLANLELIRLPDRHWIRQDKYKILMRHILERMVHRHQISIHDLIVQLIHVFWSSEDFSLIPFKF
jgi:hypothetical protein